MRHSSSLIGCLLALAVSHAAHAQTVAGEWQPVGPAPSYNGQVEGITNREVAGAVNAIAAHPSNADILYVGAVNGGLWRTTNATAASPNWTRLGDGLGSLSIGALELDPTDANRQTLLAGVARTSSLASLGGALIGLLRSTDGGDTWTTLTGGGTINNLLVFGVAGRGATLVVATSNGVYRSTNTGGAFTLISSGVGTGLPAGTTIDLAGLPGANATLFVAVTGGGSRGIYRSVDTGATWVKVSDAAVDASMASSPRTEMALRADGVMYLAIVGSTGRLAEVYRSANATLATPVWAALGVPTTTELGGVAIGAHPGGQGNTHLSVAADPSNPNLVYVGGDRQPYAGEGNQTQVFFPNSIGANDYSGRLFRGDASQAPASRWTPLTHNGTANNSSPHADSRDMAFDAAGNLIESDDGGVYRRLQPASTSGSWVSVNGNLQTTEMHSMAYDGLNNRAIGGNQDTGTTEQRDTPTRVFLSVSTGDGGDVAVEDRSSATATARYSSFQNLGNFRLRLFNASNAVTSSTFPSRTATGGSPAMTAQFYTPIATNEADGNRIIFGANNGVYESTDRASTVTRISTLVIPQFRGTPIHFGVPGNAEYLVFGSGNNVYVRTSAAGGISAGTSIGGAVQDVAVDPANSARVFALTTTTVHYSTTSGAGFSAITGNLVSTFSPGTLRTMYLVPGATPALVVGTDRGVFVAYESSGFASWSRLGTGLPNAPVFEIDHDPGDNLLVVTTLGRGVWQRTPAVTAAVENLFANGFE